MYPPDAFSDYLVSAATPTDGSTAISIQAKTENHRQRVMYTEIS